MLHFRRWQTWSILVVCLLSILLALPNTLPANVLAWLPAWYQKARIHLGLDLRGGAHFLLEVDIESVFRQKAEGLIDQARAELRKANIQIGVARPQGTGVIVPLRDPADLSRALEILRGLDSSLQAEAVGDREIKLAPSEVEVRRREQQIIDQSIEVLRRRVDPTGTTEPTIQRQGSNRILLQVPGIDDPQDLKNRINKTAKLAFHMVNEDFQPGQSMPSNSERLPYVDQRGTAENPQIVVLRRVIVGGEDLTDAQATFDQQTHRPIISFAFTTAGGRAFCTATGQNVGKRLAIVLDEGPQYGGRKVISAPVVQGSICGGHGIITGSFTTKETNELALLLRSGALPATLTVIEERSVGADLGADAIRAGTIAALIGAALVAVFMIAIYGFFGVLSVVAVAFNVVMIFAVMSALQASLTLPGIAGIVLTIGMAVDANVLIYERIREEKAAGRTALSALAAGFERAMSAIIDANVTTLIAGLLLFGFGSGPIRGFAVTLSVGLITTLFTAVLLTRLMVSEWYRRARPAQLNI